MKCWRNWAEMWKVGWSPIEDKSWKVCWEQESHQDTFRGLPKYPWARCQRYLHMSSNSLQWAHHSSTGVASLHPFWDASFHWPQGKLQSSGGKLIIYFQQYVIFKKNVKLKIMSCVVILRWDKNKLIWYATNELTQAGLTEITLRWGMGWTGLWQMQNQKPPVIPARWKRAEQECWQYQLYLKLTLSRHK